MEEPLPDFWKGFLAGAFSVVGLLAVIALLK